ncbi:MAG: cysteine--tRNA ligase [Nitrospirota bacterium]
MRIHNTMTGRKEDFVPLEAGKVKMYVCGVTVYDVCHIGHARSAIVFDVLRQYLRYRGLDVTFIKNFTDIDDKIINRAREMGIPWDEVAGRYTRKYYEDMGRLGVEPADVEPRATEHIPEIIAAIKGLEEKGYAYSVDGDVYFDIEKFSGYGKLSGRSRDEMRAGARVEVDERKRHPMDFALWKSSKEGEPAWDSPWGPGRPGWHIECTAMSMKHLGETFDIHGGGADLVFPHHENELAQSEAYTGKPKFDPEAVRFFLLQTHYRSPIEFSDALLREAETSLDRYYLTLRRAGDFLAREGGKEKAPGAEELEGVVSGFKEKFREAMDDDLNTALAIGHMFELIREVNRFLDGKPSGQKARELVKGAMEALRETGAVLRIFQRTPEEWYSSIMKLRDVGLSEEEIASLIREREEARKGKNWDRADAVRDELLKKGIVLEDGPAGTVWRVKVG